MCFTRPTSFQFGTSGLQGRPQQATTNLTAIVCSEPHPHTIFKLLRKALMCTGVPVASSFPSLGDRPNPGFCSFSGSIAQTHNFFYRNSQPLVPKVPPSLTVIFSVSSAPVSPCRLSCCQICRHAHMQVHCLSLSRSRPNDRQYLSQPTYNVALHAALPRIICNLCKASLSRNMHQLFKCIQTSSIFLAP